MIYFLILCLAMILHAIEQIYCNRAPTWLPWWIVSTRNWFGLPEKFPWKIFDGFHFFKGISLVLFYIAGKGLHNLWIEIGLWILAWQVFNLFYHKLFRKQ